MKVDLISYTKGDFVSQEFMLDYIASQSRSLKPKLIEGLFERTVDWGHKSIQEFATCVFHVQEVSRSLLAQVTRHRHATFNVMSGRHVPTTKVVLPKGIECMEGKITLEDGAEVTWWTRKDGRLVIDILKDGESNEFAQGICEVPLEDIRYGFPIGSAVSFFLRINGSSLRNFLALRLDKHAQWEIRRLACCLYDLVDDVNPVMLKGLDDLREANYGSEGGPNP